MEVEIFIVAPASTTGATLSITKGLSETSMRVLPAKSVATIPIFTVDRVTFGGVHVVEFEEAGKLAIVTLSKKVPERE